MKKLLSFLMLLTLVPMGALAADEVKNVDFYFSDTQAVPYGFYKNGQDTLEVDSTFLMSQSKKPDGVYWSQLLPHVSIILEEKIDGAGKSYQGKYVTDQSWFQNNGYVATTQGSSSILLTISPASIKNFSAYGKQLEADYDGTEKDVASIFSAYADTVKVTGTVLVNGVSHPVTLDKGDFEIVKIIGNDYTNGSGESYVQIGIKGTGNYTDTVKVEGLKIKPIQIDWAKVKVTAADSTFTGKEIKFEPKVTNEQLKSTDKAVNMEDFDVTYADNTKAGTATVTVKLKSSDLKNYTESKAKGDHLAKATPAIKKDTLKVYYKDVTKVYGTADTAVFKGDSLVFVAANSEVNDSVKKYLQEVVSYDRAKTDNSEDVALNYPVQAKIEAAALNNDSLVNYTLDLSQKSKLQITPRELFTSEHKVADSITILSDPTAQYTGSNITANDIKFSAKVDSIIAVTALRSDSALKAGEDYTVEVTPSTSSKVGDKINVTITGINNFKGDSTYAITVSKAPLTVKFKDTSLTYNDALKTDTTTGYSSYVEITGFATDADSKLLNDSIIKHLALYAGTDTITKTKEVKKDKNGNAEAYIVKAFIKDDLAKDTTGNALVLDNYSFEYPEGKLTITDNEIIAHFDTIKIKYGDPLPSSDDIKKHVSWTGASGEINWTTEPEYAVTTKKAVKNVGKYNIYVTNKPVAANYKVTINANDTLNKLVIEKLPVKFTAATQTIDYGGNIVNDTALIVQSNALAYNETLKSLGLELSYDKDSVKVGTNANAIKLTASGNTDNYDLTLVPGTLIINGGEFILTSADDDWAKIQSYAGQEVVAKWVPNRKQAWHNHETGAVIGNEHNWTADKWNTLYLPFDITVKDLSDALGYAVVNVLNASTSTADNTNFSLKVNGTIEANTPIVVKTGSALPDTVKFGTVSVVKPDSAIKRVAIGSTGNYFVGVYNGVTLSNETLGTYYFTGDNANDNWNRYNSSSSTSEWVVVPEAAYVDQSANYSADAKPMSFTMQEADGTLTKISSVEAAENAVKASAEGWYNLGGAKLNAAPTQKGVYIHNGKKVVVK